MFNEYITEFVLQFPLINSFYTRFMNYFLNFRLIRCCKKIKNEVFSFQYILMYLYTFKLLSASVGRLKMKFYQTHTHCRY